MWLIGVVMVVVGFVSIVGFNAAYIPWLLIGLGAVIIVKGSSHYRPTTTGARPVALSRSATTSARTSSNSSGKLRCAHWCWAAAA
ncbi:hypothetical protein EDD99_5481 [Streptomyces sp. 846.5]|nr:hypothetical protein [Streptomyces sp. 846.5]TDT97354.1 hypothetical protein EDD99_5481 [Streptomyces sp. 846.5]